MLIPLLDKPINRRLPVVTAALVAVNAAVFLLTMLPSEAGTQRIWTDWGVVPETLDPRGFLGYMFLHGGVGHLIGNMLFLFFFGCNVERRQGSAAFFAGYLLTGLWSALAFVGTLWALLPPDRWEAMADKPLVGASGAISGIMGMYLVHFWRRNIGVGYFALVLAGAFRIRAYWFFLLYMGIQIALGLTMSHLSPVAYWAHVHGFLGGVAWALLLKGVRFPFGPIEESEEEKPFTETYEEFDYLPEAHVETGPAAQGVREVVTQIYRGDVAGAFAVIPERYTRITRRIAGVVGERLPGAEPPRPHCLATAVTRQTVEALQRDLAAEGVRTLLFPAREVLQDPLVLRVRELRVDGDEGIAVDEFGQSHPIRAQEVFFLSSGRVMQLAVGPGPAVVVDLVLLRPLTVLRLVEGAIDGARRDGEAASTPAGVAALVRAAFPRASCTKPLVGLAQGAGMEAGFGDEREYGDFLLWALQLVSTPFYRQKRKATGPPGAA